MFTTLRVLTPIAIAALAGCASDSGTVRREIALRDFAQPSAGLQTDDARAGDSIVDASANADASGDGAKPAEPASSDSLATGTQASSGAGADPKSQGARPLGPGESWPIEGLVGQLNGRPLFADEFFEPIEDEIIALVAARDRAEADRILRELVRRRFARTVDNELVIAEAESQLSPEQQEGLFAWLRSFQEETIAERGGSRAAAEASLEGEGAMSLEEFMQEQRDEVLVRQLMRDRITPRVIVSWRDVVQEYERRFAEFNPAPTIRIGRIRLSTTADAERIEVVRKRIAEGKDFPSIATELGVADGGFWEQFGLPPEGVKGLQLSDAIKQRIDGLAVGAVSAPIEQREFISWLAVLSIEQGTKRSLYDMDVQLGLERELMSRREFFERDRYLNTLRSRWTSDDLGRMEAKLIEIAVSRYLR
jgi:hypothetical protein